MSAILVPLTRGQSAIIDEADLDIVSTFKWNCSSHGYANTRLNNKVVYLHRFLLGAPKGTIVDHINRNKLDNRRSNLRFVTPKQSSWNTGPKRKHNIYKGVCWNGDCDKWMAQCNVEGQTSRFLGLFDTKEEAAQAYDCAAILEQGEFAVLNFERENYEKRFYYVYNPKS